MTRRAILASQVEPTPSVRNALEARYRQVRATTEWLRAPLEIEDLVPQSMPDCSPTKWHLAHTSWFFETFLLKPAGDARNVSDPKYAYLFNSYYNALGERIERPRRGLLTRPTVAEVQRYREAVDQRMLALIDSADERELARLAPLVELGLNHEQQHQELILTDVKHLLGCNPLRPSYRGRSGVEEPTPGLKPSANSWVEFAGGLVSVGFEGDGFAFDNESPRHQVFLRPYRLSDRPVSNGDFLAFLEDGGYDRPEFWLSDGWAARLAQGWSAPSYWEKADDGAWRIFTLDGMRALDLAEPVCHVSFYEADAFARWSNARLPSEFEWEHAASTTSVEGNFLETEAFHPRARSGASSTPSQLFGDVWEWTASPYLAYPGYRPLEGALGEYNGKFMCNQFVLRGGSCASPSSHLRATYRNFFPPDARWQFSGLRLAQDG
ncbi:MAG: ergothioneine biosynthesis protein EgtB [Isosphaeraceae bacterium]